MATISFDSVGILADVRQTVVPTEEQISPIPFGIKTPLAYSPGSLFEMTYTITEQISDNFKNLILTNFGDRVGIAQYGANLTPLLADFTDVNTFNAEAMARIKTAVVKWMPYVQLKGYESFPEFLNGRFQKRIKLLIAYRVPQIPILAKTDSLLELELRML